MPEGHTTHRLARLHRLAFTGDRVRCDSPQGKFTDVGELDGCRLDDVEAYGKHLFYRFDGAALLHVHLGLFGRFRRYAVARAPAPSGATRLRLRTERAEVHLSGPAACELFDDDQRAALLARLGPDPLRRDAHADDAWAALQRRRSAIGQALLDQAVIAGIGNVYRAEALFRAGIHPDRPAAQLTRDEFDALWADLVGLLRLGERSGRIVTVEPHDVRVTTPAHVPDDARMYVYRRAGEPCRRCGATVVAWPLGGRTVSACPSCQQ